MNNLFHMFFRMVDKEPLLSLVISNIKYISDISAMQSLLVSKIILGWLIINQLSVNFFSNKKRISATNAMQSLLV